MRPFCLTMFFCWVTLIIMKSLILPVDAGKILILLYQFPSHLIMKLGMASELISHGHEVHIILAPGNPMRSQVQSLGVHIIDYQAHADLLYPFQEDFNDILAQHIFNRTPELPLLHQTLSTECLYMMTDEVFIGQLGALKFDLLLIEPFMAYPCYLLLPHRLGVPFVIALTILTPFSARVPALPSFSAFPKMGSALPKYPALQKFTERMKNVFYYAAIHLLLLPELWKDTSLLQKYAPNIDSWDELFLKAEMVLVEEDYILNHPWPLLPHVVSVGGGTVRPAKQLTGVLEQVFADVGDRGIIMASFGSSGLRFSPTMVKKLFDAFDRIDEFVLLRLKVPYGAKVPDNVRLMTWLPQNDILGHPKTKLFITHCGSNSQYEALYHAVPMLGIPMYAEQGWNCARAEYKGIARCLDQVEFSADELYNNIRDLIDNVTYSTKVKKLSEIWRAEPLFGSQKAAFWIDHVMKYGGSHLRSPALDLAMHEFLMIDIIVVFSILFASVLICMKWLIVMSIRKCMRLKLKKD